LNEIFCLTFPRYFWITTNHYGGNERKNDLKMSEFNKIMRFYPSGIGGHSVRPYLDFLNSSKNHRITFLRDPIERYLSQYNHEHETGLAPNFDFFLNREYSKNFITKKICGEDNYHSAKKILDDFFFVGNSGQFNRSMNMLSDILETKFYLYQGSYNVRKNRNDYLSYQDLNNKEITKMLCNNDSDIRLYEHYFVKNDHIKSYSDIPNYKDPSKFRVRLIQKINILKKKKIMPRIRKC